MTVNEMLEKFKWLKKQGLGDKIVWTACTDKLGGISPAEIDYDGEYKDIRIVGSI